MSANQVEKHAMRLHKYLVDRGKYFDKAWRQRIRKLLADTYNAMNARPLDGKRCLALSDEIDAELASLDKMSFDGMIEISVKDRAAKSAAKASDKQTQTTPANRNPSSNKTGRSGSSAEHSPETGDLQENRAYSRRQSPGDLEQEPQSATAKNDNDADELRANDAKNANANDDCTQKIEDFDYLSNDMQLSGNGQTANAAQTAENQNTITAAPPEQDGGIGLFDLIRAEIRCIIKIRAVVRPPFIGKFVSFAEAFAEHLESRIEAFIAVLSPDAEKLGAKTDTEVGYEDDLIPNMPGFDLVLHPKKKKR